MLPACPAGTVGVHPDVLIPHFNVNVLLNVRHYVAGDKRGLPLACRVERRNAHQPVHALFGFQIAIRILSVHLERKALVRRPPCKHPVEHPGPVAGLRPPCPRMEGEDRIVFVVLPGKQRLHADALKRRLKFDQLLLHLIHKGRVIFLVP